MRGVSTATVAFLAGVATAWMPRDRDMTSTKTGENLFKRSETIGKEKRYLPGTLPIRGVNLGAYFVFEPWMASDVWANDIGCDGQASEFDCVLALGQDTANSKFQSHWGSWITQDDINKIASYGLNTVRIPLGYWIYDGLKDSSEHFPSGQMQYLQNVCGWAADKGLYVILDLHGAPYGQVGHNADTGQSAADPSDSTPDFYQTSQYDRALQFLGNLTQTVHQNGGDGGAFRTVGMLEIVNEPITQQNDLTDSMRSYYYPKAFDTIRGVESSMSVSGDSALNIQMMNAKWGSGDPNEHVSDLTNAAYDDHRYLCFDGSVDQSQDGYLGSTCGDDRSGNTPTITGEWSLSINADHQFDSQFWPISDNLDFYKNWFAAQVQLYERQDGWIFWNWKTSGLNDPRWDYQAAVDAGMIPTDLNSIGGITPCG